MSQQEADQARGAGGPRGDGRDTWLRRHPAVWLVPLAVVAGLLLAEGAVRLFPSLVPTNVAQKVLWARQVKPKSIGDPYLGFRYPPYYRAEARSLDYRFTIKADEHGFRNRSPWPGQADVVIVGDSMAYGYGVEEPDMWPRLLERELGGARVITLGMPGAVPQQYVRYFQRFGVVLRPRTVVFTVFAGNDLVESETFERWLAAGSPGNYDTWRFFGGQPPPNQHSLLESSYLYTIGREVSRTLGQSSSSLQVTLPGGERLRLAPEQYQSVERRARPGDRGLDAMIRSVQDANRLAQGIGARLLVLFVPTKERVYLPVHGLSFPNLIDPIKESLAAEPGIEILDLTDELVARATRGEVLYFEIDGHPNEQGNLAMAAAVARRLQDER